VKVIQITGENPPINVLIQIALLSQIARIPRIRHGIRRSEERWWSLS